MKPIILPFGLNEKNILVHIADVERGKKCNCVCPSCRTPLIARKGSKNQPHFQHAVDYECKSGMESAIHLAAKKMIMEKKQITLPKCDLKVSEKDSRGNEHSESKTVVEEGAVICFDSVQEEIELHGMKADILAKKGNRPIIIEIFYQHKVDDQKLAKIVETNISAIEINLSDLKAENVKDWQTIWQSISNPMRVQWLHNAKAQDLNGQLQKQVTLKIRKREEKYKNEEELFLHALDDLKARSSKGSVEQLKQNAEMHPVWKYNAQHLPFSWNELPEFVNAEISDGDWIFGCDRRVWQTAFYKSFIWRNDKPFSIKNVDGWLQNKIRCNVHQSVKVLGVYRKRYSKHVPADIYINLPSPWKTLRAYFNYLCELGMLEFSGDDYHSPGNGWFRVVSKKPCRSPSKMAHFD